MTDAVMGKILRFEALKAKMPTSELPRWSLAQALEEAGRKADAEAEYEALVALKPDYCLAWLRLGALRLGSGNTEGARAALVEGRRLAIDQGHNAPRIEADRLMAELDGDEDWPT